ncbi:MAG: cysteine--tRNA ligase, partial [Selenomonadales bacterium]|nr:cysteine--tRNA ligase [Selenomonadales bacterium]
EAQGLYMDMANVIGILEQEEEAAQDDDLASDLMELIIEIRQQARQEKNWPVADRIRARLGELGIVLEDSPQGVKWKRQ